MLCLHFKYEHEEQKSKEILPQLPDVSVQMLVFVQLDV